MGRIEIHYNHEHAKASERYVSVTFRYDDGEVWEGWIPTEYRRTGTDLKTPGQVLEHLEAAYPYCNSNRWSEWRQDQAAFWKTKPNARVTKPFYDVLEPFRWSCTACSFPLNTNPARRIQDLKEFGYTLATDKRRDCLKCGRNGAHHLMVPLPRGGISGYEAWPPDLRKRIIALHEAIDVYEGKKANPTSLIPDHKFPEIRWDAATRRHNLEQLSVDVILADFQLLSNQRNLQKREVCRTCYQTGRRGYPFGIRFFYHGDENWPATVPRKGKDAEQGCVGCGWYDLAAWRAACLARLDRT